MFVHAAILLSLAVYSSAMNNAIDVDEFSKLQSRLASVTVLDAWHFQFPEIISIQSGGKHICQGHIIAPNMSLTAASCFWNMATNTMMVPEDLKLQFGSHDNTAATDPTLTADVLSIHIHPGFAIYPTSKVFEKDLALLVPKVDFPINNWTIAAIPLAKKSTNNTKDGNIKDSSRVASWGKKGDGNGKPTDSGNMLKFVETTFYKQANCTYLYANTPFPYDVQAFTVCTDFALGNTLCEGDVGAGVRVVDKTDIPNLIGIGSQILTGECPNKLLPDLYTRTAPFLTWIQEKGGPKAA